VVVLNAKDILVTGKKAEQKLYRHHTMHPGGLKEITFEKLQAKDSTEVYIYRRQSGINANDYYYSLFAKLYLACYQRINFVKCAWIV
jgi:hypothetical protein